MVKTHEDINKCRKAIERLEALGVPTPTCNDLRIWLKKEEQKLHRRR